MAGELKETKEGHCAVRVFPNVVKDGEGRVTIPVTTDDIIRELTGMKTVAAANVVFCSALEGLGSEATEAGTMASAMFAEIEPRDAVEAMLVAQMTATHMAMTKMASRITYQTTSTLRESNERSMCRLGRLFTSQMDALKKYRRKAQPGGAGGARDGQ